MSILRNLAICILGAVYMLSHTFSATAEELKLGTLGAFLQDTGKPDAPLVLIIPGSGAVDRDGNIPSMGMKPAIYRLLAGKLAERGIASVRIDKRGMHSSASPEVAPNAARMEIYADDIRAWITYLKQEYRRKNIWLLGHSEGGLVALLTAHQNQNGVCGLILAATPGRKLGIVLREQLQKNLKHTTLLPTALAAVESLEQGKAVDTTEFPEPLMRLFRPAVQQYMIHQMRLDPAALLAPLSLPVLVVQGESDLQVTPEDAQKLHGAKPDATLALLPGVTHTLKEQPAGASPSATYTDPDLPVAEMLVEKIAGFILEKQKRRQ